MCGILPPRSMEPRVDPSDKTEQLGDANSDVGFFAKRSRASKPRKRARSSLHDDSDEKVKLALPVAQKSKRDTGSSLPQDAFKVGAKSELSSSGATAQRIDVGGKTIVHGRSAKSSFGPLSAPSNLRASVRVDYQPDVCKDYKETGYCGFGDSCKFLHDRSDYKAGWQLDRDWSQREQDKRAISSDKRIVKLASDEKKELDADGLPFACHLCRGDFTRPVVTLCEHYFCEDCIIQEMEKKSTCPICQKQLRGTLNRASRLCQRLEERKRDKV